jgi:hypothetical protein
MAGNCSTRDGRSRVGAPSSPHLTWMAKLPTDSTGQGGPSAIATDASGNAYVIATGELDESIAALRRVRASDGTIEWTDPITTDEETSTPIVLSHGGVDMFAYNAMTAESLFTFDHASGASTSTTFGVTLYDAPGDLAVGSDGSLYLTHAEGVGTIKQTTFVSRVAPGGSILWTSVDLATLGPPPEYDDGFIDPMTLALAKDDLVIAAYVVVAKTGDASVTSAFDAATGVMRWTTVLPGELVGGPVVRADGSIVALLSQSAPATSLVVFDPQCGVPLTTPLSGGVFQVSAVALDGTVIGGADSGNGITGLVAIASDGTALWNGPGFGNATIASDGTVVSFGSNITALDGATGQVKWQLAPPSRRVVHPRRGADERRHARRTAVRRDALRGERLIVPRGRSDRRSARLGSRPCSGYPSHPRRGAGFLRMAGGSRGH